MFAPQVLNFLYSLPQLFKLVPCPRHRLPGVAAPDAAAGATVDASAPRLRVPSRVQPDDARANMTLLNAALRVCGPMTERSLCIILLAFQARVACAHEARTRNATARVLPAFCFSR